MTAGVTCAAVAASVVESRRRLITAHGDTRSAGSSPYAYLDVVLPDVARNRHAVPSLTGMAGEHRRQLVVSLVSGDDCGPGARVIRVVGEHDPPTVQPATIAADVPLVAILTAVDLRHVGIELSSGIEFRQDDFRSLLC